MRTLTRYILKEMVGPTLLGFIFYTALILMQRLFDMAGMIIQRSLSLSDVLKLLWLSLPHIVVLTVPMSLLFGVLIAVGRLSSDSEIIAMRALGISTRSIYLPVFLFSLAMFLVNLYLINAVMPKGNRQLQSLQAELLTSTVEKEIRPRLFFDEYENLMIYINDVDRETGHWRGVFVADSRSSDPAEGTSPAAIVRRAQQQAREDEKAEVAALAHRSGQRIIVAERGTLAVVKPTKEVWMNLTDAATHLWDPSRPERYDLNTNATQRILVADPASTNLFSSRNIARSLREMSLDELLDQARLTARGDEITHNLARVEIHKKFAIPFACIAFGILGLPLGITNRRGGKSSGFSLSIGIILFYYVMINNGEHLAASGRIPPAVGMWSANLILLGLGIYLLRRANRETGTQPAEGGILARIRHLAGRVVAAREPESGRVTDEERSLLGRLDITFPNTLDRYVLREFLKVLGLVLVSVMALFIIVDYTDVARKLRDNEVGVGVLLEYYRFLIFQILNWTLPISVLVATLVTFGILSKNNEVTAAKSGGVSLYRLSLPIVLVAAVISVLAYFILDFVLPYSNQRVANLRRTIEGKTPVASASQQKLWYLGQGRYLINFLSYNRDRQELAQVQVFEFHPADFRITRRIYADRARWAGEGWAFENGWIRSFPDGAEASTYTPITRPVTIATYRETPEDFVMELKTPEQMTYAQLRNYIETIRKTGYAADDLAVQLYSKTSWPVISLVMALIALPFAFRIGHRGALYGIGIALALGFCYWMIYAIFTKFGEIGNLPALLSAWSANVLFAIAAVYLFLHVET